MNKSLKRRSRKAPKKNKSRSKRPRSKRPRSRFGKAEERERKVKEIADRAKSRGLTPAQYLYQRDRDSRNHLIVPTPPTRLDRALELSRNSGPKYSSNPERSTYTVSRSEFETTIQDLHKSMTRLQRDTTELIQNLHD